MKERLHRRRQMARFLVMVMLISCCPVFNNQGAEAKDYTNGGCVQWVKDRAMEKLGITLPATGKRPTGKYAALNYWTILPEQGYVQSATPRKDSLAIWDGGIGNYAGYGHVAYVEEVNGNQVYLSEGGYAGGNQGNGVNIGWWNANNLNRPKSGQTFLGYIYLTGSAPSSGLSYTEIKTEFVDTWNAGLYGHIDNPGRIQLSTVGAYVWDEAGTLVVNHREDCALSTSYVDQRLNIVGEALPSGLRSGASYTYQFYAIANGTEYKSAVGSFTVVDDQKPEITNVTISDQSETGYTISCQVTDNYQVDRVQFPTWTEENGQDDMVADWWSNSAVRGRKNGDVYTFRVNCSDHKNEHGTYHTHIYAYDKAGNYCCVPIENVVTAEINATPAPSAQDPGQGGHPVVTVDPTETAKPGNTTNPGTSDNYTGQKAIYHNNLSIYQNQRSDERMMEYLLMEPDNVYAYLINDEIREVCRKITANCKTDMEKLQEIHDWVCNNLYYENADNHGEGTGVGAIWVFYHRGTRCEGYADLTAAMCREVGIPCKEMWGTSVPANIDGLTIQEIKELASNNPYLKHAWNEAWVDGRWVLLDTTWDSRNYSETSNSEVVYQPCQQTYFDMSLEEFSKTHLFDEYISIFEYLFDEWDQKTAGTDVPPTNAPAGSPSSNPTGSSSGSSGSKVKSSSSGSAGGINQKHSLVSKPGRVSIKKVKKDGLGCAKITWKKVKCNEGYQIQYSRKRSFSSKKTKTSFSKSTYILGKSKKTYYIRVRAVNSGWTSQTQYGNRYGKWSKVRKIRLK